MAQLTFHVGQKVGCISEWDNESFRGCNVPCKGVVYTIREIDDGLRFEELLNAVQLVQSTSTGITEQDEPSFWPENFRPIVKRKTDISIFTEMLTNTGVDA